MSYRRNYAGLRIESLPDPATISECAARLGLDRRTIRYWLTRDDFRKAKIATRSGNKWLLDKKRLKAWLVYIGSINPRQGAVRQNPPKTKGEYRDAQREQARKELGL